MTGPTMPDPERVVSQSVAVCERMGMERNSALFLISQISMELFTRLTGAPGVDATWIAKIGGEALYRLVDRNALDILPMRGQDEQRRNGT